MSEKLNKLTQELLVKVEEQMYSEVALNQPNKVDELLKIVEEHIRKDSTENDI